MKPPMKLFLDTADVAVSNLPAIERIFAHMFEALEAPHFIVTERIVQNQQCLLVWDFRFRFRRFDTDTWQTVRGGTHLVFNDAGQVTLFDRAAGTELDRLLAQRHGDAAAVLMDLAVRPRMDRTVLGQLWGVLALLPRLQLVVSRR